MQIRAIAFTDNGKQIIEKLNNAYDNIQDVDFEGYLKYENANTTDNNGRFSFVEESLSDWTKDAFEHKCAIVFVSAMGIAVRAVAECVKDKLSDSPVIVVDDRGQFVIPMLSGHVGGANELAMDMADKLHAIPVVTTSTDNNDAFSVDLFAKENNLKIVNRDGIKKVSGKAIEGKCVTLSIKGYPPKEAVDVIVSDETAYSSLIRLSPKKYVVGMGLKRGKSFEELEQFLISVLNDNNIYIDDIGAIATIDIKLDENGLHKLKNKYRLPLLGFDADILNKAAGEFTSSQFVKDTVGVDNVCERAAVVATNQGKLVVKKQTNDGITIAIAQYGA